MTDSASQPSVQDENKIPSTENEMPAKTERYTDEGQDLPKKDDTEAQQTPGDPTKQGFKPRKTPKPLDLRMLDLRVGKVKDVEEVEDMDGIYSLEIDIDKPENRIASARLFCEGFDMYDLIDTKVVTVLNTPVIELNSELECNIRVLAAVRMGGEDGKVVEAFEVLRPPKKAKRGYRVFAEGYVQEQYYSIKEKVYNIIKKDLMVDSEKRAVYRGVPLKVEKCKDYITTESLTDCPITHL